MRERNLKSGIQKHFVEKNTTKMNDVEGVLDISIADDDLLAALEIDVSVLKTFSRKKLYSPPC